MPKRERKTLTELQYEVAGNYGLDPDAINEEFNPQDYLFCTLCEFGMDEVEVCELIKY
tara:strand:+ start:430 stop:603 length:174 start_codon:yes stop_codon:yes gene_type:complete